MQSLSASTISYFVLASVAVAAGCGGSTDEKLPGFGPIGGGTGGRSGGSGAAPSTSMGGVGSPGTGSGGGSGITVPVNTAGQAPVDQCAETKSTADPLPPVLEFLIDTSGSMGKAPDGAPAGTATKWKSTQAALSKAFTDMADGTGTGLIFYPNVSGGFGGPPIGGGSGGAGAGGGGKCINKQVAVPLAALTMAQRTQILNQITRKTVNGNTPTHDAYQFAVETVAASMLPGSKYVVLVTDGSPTFSLGCVGDGLTEVDAAPIVAEAGKAAAQGIKTFVIGSPGSEATRTSLSQMATQGGTAPPGCSDLGPNYCHFDMTQVADLSTALNDAFKAITTQIVSCSYNVPETSGGKLVDPKKVSVTLTSSSGADAPLPKQDAADCADGWRYTPDMKQVILCTNTCAAVTADVNAKVGLVFGCTDITK